MSSKSVYYSIIPSLAPVREQCFETGIVSALVTLLLSQDQDLLLHVSQAIARICYNSSEWT